MTTAWRSSALADNAWDKTLASVAGANVFQSSSWARHKADSGWRPVRALAGPDEAPLAAVQGLVKDLPAGVRLLWARGGPVGEPSLWNADLRAVLARAAGGTVAYGRICSYREAGPSARLDALGWSRPARPLDRNMTFSLDLTPEPEALQHGLSANWRHNLKRGLTRSAVEDWREPDPKEMESLYRALEALKGLPPQHRADELSSLVRALGSSLIIKRTVVEGRTVAMRACAVFGGTAVDLLAAAADEARKTYASYALLWALILEARCRGARTYDLGGADPEAARGVADFKKGVGGRLIETVGEWDFARPAALRRPAGALIALARSPSDVGPRPRASIEFPTAGRRLLRRAWMKYGVGISSSLYSDDRKRLELAYMIPDPWFMESPAERDRFEKVNDVIRRKLGRVGSILEIGSGEGHHTAKLLECAARVDGLELSSRAVARARKRCPGTLFFETSFPELPQGLKPPYDLVMATEALYYFKDVGSAIAAMERLGRHCLVTFYKDQWERLAPFFQDRPEVYCETFELAPAAWKLYLWKSPDRGAAQAAPHAGLHPE